MITRRTRIQLAIFVVITLLGVSYVGARYARLDRVFFDDHYTVVAHFPESGGIFEGAEVSYRGVTIGEVSDMELTDEGVDVLLDIDNSWDTIPAETIALVGNRSAVGEQYVELQPKVDDGPYLEDHSEIAIEDTRTPIPTAKLIEDISTTFGSVDREALTTVVSELGTAFDGTGEDLGQIIDTSNSFIATANDNFDITTALIRDSNTVLNAQLDSASAIRNFTRNLALFSTTMAGADADLRRVIDNGSATATELRTFIEENRVDLSSLLNNLVTTGEIVVERLDGVEQILVLYPWVVEGGFTVVSQDPATKQWDAHFGLITTEHHLCHRGYEATNTRPPEDRDDLPMTTSVRCAENANESSARGAQHAPRADAAYRGPVAFWDRETGKISWQRALPGLAVPGTVAPRTLGKESWKWLLLQPLVQTTK